MKKTLIAALALAAFPLSASAQSDFHEAPASTRALFPEDKAAAPDAPSAEAPPAPPPPAPAKPALTPARPISLSSRKASDAVWADSARFFVGARSGIGVPPSGEGLAPTAGLEVGVAADSGLGLGLHFLTAFNPPDAPTLGIRKAQWAMGAAADVRWYFQTVKPLTLYPTVSVGFLAGPAMDGRNVVLPMLNPGFGARVRLGQIYTAFEFGLMSFQVPFVALAFGFEPDRKQEG